MHVEPTQDLSEKDLFETALRVLSSWNQWQTPDERDIAILRRATPRSPHRGVDELACSVILSLDPRRFSPAPDAKPDGETAAPEPDRRPDAGKNRGLTLVAPRKRQR